MGFFGHVGALSAAIKGGENSGIRELVPIDVETQINRWKP